jgi:Ca2+-binding EF-hand superfamily protein
VRANPPPVLANEGLGSTVRGLAEMNNDQAKRIRSLLV